jgi:hypothetical protein
MRFQIKHDAETDQWFVLEGEEVRFRGSITEARDWLDREDNCAPNLPAPHMGRLPRNAPVQEERQAP